MARGLPASTEHPRRSMRSRWLVGEVAWCASPGRCPGRSRARQAQWIMLSGEIIKVWPGRRPMVLLLVKSRRVYWAEIFSESSTPAFLAENSAGWETSAPIRPERQGIAAGPALDQQLQSRAPWTHADLGCLAGAAACARRSIERPRGGLESKRKSQPLRDMITHTSVRTVLLTVLHMLLAGRMSSARAASLGTALVLQSSPCCPR